MPNKKKKNSNIVLDFARGFLTKKKTFLLLLQFVKAAEKKNAALKKLGY